LRKQRVTGFFMKLVVFVFRVDRQKSSRFHHKSVNHQRIKVCATLGLVFGAKAIPDCWGSP
jgi:hypothetical protein